MGTILTKKTKKMWWLFGLLAIGLIGLSIFKVGKASSEGEFTHGSPAIVTQNKLTFGSDIINTCIEESVTPDQWYYLDFSKLENASLGALKDLARKQDDYDGFELKLLPRNPPKRLWRFYNYERRVCNSKIPKNAKFYKFSYPAKDDIYTNEQGQQRRRLKARYYFWAVDGKLVQIDGYLL